jgi:hypothetical protein
MFNPTAVDNVRRIGSESRRIASEKARQFLRQSVSQSKTSFNPGGHAHVEAEVHQGSAAMRNEAARRRAEEFEAKRGINPRLQREIDNKATELILFRAKHDSELSKLIARIKNKKYDSNDIRIYNEIIQRTILEVMEEKGISPQQQ